MLHSSNTGNQDVNPSKGRSIEKRQAIQNWPKALGRGRVKVVVARVAEASFNQTSPRLRYRHHADELFD